MAHSSASEPSSRTSGAGTTEERQRDLGLAAEDLIRKVLSLADDFDLAIEALAGGDRRRPVVRGRERHRSQAADAARERGRYADRGRPRYRLDLREHDAIANVPGSGRPEGEIVEQIRRGYKLRDRVLRPALVAVAAGEPTTTDESLPN